MKSVRYAILPIFILMGFLIYSNILYGPFILDDGIYITDNYQMQNISHFLKDFSGTRYIGYLSFAINYYFGGLDTFGYHLVNIIIHIINAILVYILIEAMGYRLRAMGNKENPSPLSSRLLPIACSLIFLVHPIQTQAVSYITQRFTSLATLFYLLSLVLYVKARGKGQEAKGEGLFTISLTPYAFSLFSAILAMKTKEISWTLPFVIALYEFAFFSNNGLKTQKRILYLSPFFLTLFIIPFELFWPKNADTLVSGTSGADLGEMIRELQLKDINDVSVYNYFITQFSVIVTYMRLLVLPINQTLLYDYPFSQSLFEPATFISGIFLLIVFSSAVYLYFRSRITHHAHGLLISFGLLWFFITLSIESSFIPIKDVIFEHRLYLPSVGFILSAVTALFYGFGYLEKRINRPLGNHLLAVVVIAAVILSFSTYRRNILWGDSYFMYLDNVNKAPNMAVLHNNIGNLYAKQNQLDKAIKEYLTALKLESDYPPPHNSLGIAYLKQGRIDEGIKEFLTALRLKPDYTDAHNNLGIAYLEQGRIDEAIKEYLTALRLRPDHPDIHYNLGVAYSKQNQIDEAIKEYMAALKLKPDITDAHYNLGLAYKTKGLKYEAKKEFEMVLKLNPDNEAARQAIESLEK